MLIGINFIKKFNITTFDYENKEISFYSNNVKINIIGEDRNIRFYSISSFVSLGY